MKNNVMVDLETLSLANNPVILSIGAVRFSKEGLAEEFYAKISIASCIDAGLHECPDTKAWWKKQDRKVRAEAMSGYKGLKETLMDFTSWLGEDAIVWGNGATADNIWLANAYRAVGQEVPWKFYKDRCYRTMLALFEPLAWVKPEVAHHALSDAKSQALNLIHSAHLHNYEL